MEETPSSQTVSTKLERIAKLAKQAPDDGVSRRSPITSTSTGCARRTGARARTARRASTDRARSEYASEPGGQPPVAARPREVRHVPRAAGAAGPHPEGRWDANAPDRHPDLRGQGPAARGRDGAGGRLRAGLSGLLVRLPAGALGAPSARTRCSNATMAMAGGWVLEVDIRKFFDTLDHGHLREILRQQGTRRSAAATHRQVAERGRAGGRGSCRTRTPARRRAG